MRHCRTLIATSSLLLGLLVGCNGGPEGNGDGPATPPTKSKRIARFTFKNLDSNQETGSVLTGKTAKLVNSKGESVELASFQGKPLVLVFMRGFFGDICPYCTTYTAQIADRYVELKKAGAEVLVVYPTKANETKKVDEFKKIVNEILLEDGKDAIPFPVFLDPGTKVVQHYNLVGDLSKPSTFVLDAKGKITYVYIGRSTDDRPSVDRILEEVKALSSRG